MSYPETKSEDTARLSNSDLNQTDQGTTLTFSVGPSPFPETQIRKVIYEDEYLRCHGVWETDGRFFIHNDLYEPQKPSHIKHYKKFLEALEEQLRSKGFDKYYTFADSPNGFRYNTMMGFRSNLEVWDDIYEVMVKDT